MLTEKIKKHSDYVVQKIDESNKISDNDKILYRELVENTKNGCNGLTPEEKLQCCSENIFYLASLLIMDKCNKSKESKLTPLYETITKCKNQIVIIIGIISTLLIFRPELATLIKSIL